VTLRILVVEDDHLQAKGISRILHRVGASSLIAGTVARAKEILAATRVDAVTVDLTLPDGDGLSILESSEAIPLPALVISGHVDRELLQRALAVGARYVQKPLSGDELESFIKGVDARKRSGEARVETVVGAWAKRYRLTKAEAKVLHARAQGAARDELAALRGVSPATIDRQVKDLLDKTGDTTLDAAVARLLREALSASSEI
jgi:DNA-binding NarL/FixJ family response regulator